MRNNPVFQRVVDYVTENKTTETQIKSVSDAQLIKVMFPPDGVRPKGDYTRVSSVKNGLAHIYRERKQAARVADLISKIEATYPGVTIESLGDGKYLLTIGDGDK